MTSAELIRNFQERNHVQLNGEDLRMTIDRILTVNTDNRERESVIGQYIASVYPQIADEFERNRVKGSVENTGNASKTTALEFFEEYVNIISQIVNESSDTMSKQAIENAEKAKQTLEEAEQKYQREVERYEEAQFFQSTGTNINMEPYRTKLDDAEAALNIAKEKNNSATPFNPYESTMDYFGFSGLDALKMLDNQLNSHTYIEARRSQIESSGVTNPTYFAECSQTFGENVKYQNASADVKRKMQEVYITKQLMQEKLDSHTGISGWLWRITHRTETNAMKSYIGYARNALFSAGFDKAAEAEAIDAMSERGYFSAEYSGSILDAVNEKFAKNEKIYAPVRDKKAEVKAISNLPLKDQLFEIKFRPSKNVETLNQQNQAFKEVKAIVENNKNIPEDVMKVFEANRKKLKQVMGLYAKSQSQGPQVMNRRDTLCENIETELLTQVSQDNYKPMTFDQIAAMNDQKLIEDQKVQVAVNLDNPNEKQELSQPVVVDPSLEKEPIVKSN